MAIAATKELTRREQAIELLVAEYGLTSAFVAQQIDRIFLKQLTAPAAVPAPTEQAAAESPAADTSAGPPETAQT